MAEKNIKTIGILGWAGSIGQRHASNLLGMGHHVIGYDPAKDGPDMRSGLFDDVDGMVIASPSSEHWGDLDFVLNKNKHVFVEKPIGSQRNMHTARCFEIAKERNLVVMVGNNLRFHPCVIAAKEFMEQIGDPIWANFTCAQFTDKLPYIRDGVTLNWGSHEVDLALYLLGPAKVVGACIDEGDTIADINLIHHNCTHCSIHLDYLTKPERRGFVIVGTEGQIEVDLVNRTIATDANEDAIQKWGSYDHDYKAEMQAFLDRIDRKEALGATGQDGLAALEICLKAKEMAGIE